MEISKRRKIRGLEEWKIGKGNGKRRWIATPTMSARNDGQYGFTLVELVIVIAIVIVLSVVSVPIYRSYVDKAKYSEGYALHGTILSAQKAYYSEYGNFLLYSSGNWTSYDPVLGVDARGNKYFTLFHAGVDTGNNIKINFYTGARKPDELVKHTGYAYVLYLQYNITKGSRFLDEEWDTSWLE